MYLLILSLGFPVICIAESSKLLSLVLTQLLSMLHLVYRRGLCIGPLLFLIYVDGLAELPMHSGSLIMFAVDALLYKVVQSITDFQDLQSDVNSIVQWTADNDLKLSVKSLLLLRKCVPMCTHTIVINDQPLEKVQSYKYLGLHISIYPRTTTFLMYAQELKSKWACCIVASIVTVTPTH